MKAGKLADILETVSALYGLISATHGASDMKDLLSKLRFSPRQNLLVAAALMEPRSMIKRRDGLMIHELLNKVAAFQKASGANSAAKKSVELAEALEQVAPKGVTVAQFSAQIDGLDTVDAFVQKLISMRGNRTGFDQVMALLTKRGTVTKTQICKIAHGYAGGPKNYPSASKAALAIQQKFTSDMLFASKIA